MHTVVFFYAIDSFPELHFKISINQNITIYHDTYRISSIAYPYKVRKAPLLLIFLN